MKHLWSVNERKKSPSSHSAKTHRCVISTLGDVTNAGWIRRGFVPSKHVSAPTKSQLSQEAKTELLDRGGGVKTGDSSCKVVSNFWIINTRLAGTDLQMCRGATCAPMPSSAKASTDRPFTQGTKRCTSSCWSTLAALLLHLVEKTSSKMQNALQSGIYERANLTQLLLL